MSKKYISVSLFLIFFGFSAVFGNTAEREDAFYINSFVSFNIRYYDKRVYYLERDPILIQVTITNNGPAAFRFKLADERVFSLDFDVRTTRNTPVEAADILIRRRSQSRQVYFREISIETGESFSFVEDLRDYSEFSSSGSYIVKARIYPELYHGTAASGPEGAAASPNAATSPYIVESNRLSLSLRPANMTGPDGVPYELDVETNAILVRERRPPDEVISYLLEARQKGQWEKFFLYLDLEAMLSRNSVLRRQWNAESEEGRRRMLTRYREELRGAVTDTDISLIPMDFTIERTSYNGQSGTVTVLEYFRIGSYIERKRYTWYLEKKDDYWIVVDYSVVNLGTE